MVEKTPPAKWQFYGWTLWFIAALFYGYEFIHRVAPSILTFELRDAFDVNDHQLGIMGALYFYAYALCQIPAGILIDRYGPIKPLLIAAGVLTFGSFLFATTSFTGFAYLSRICIGAGSAFAFIGCLKIASQWLKKRSFPLVVGLTNLFGTLGAVLGGTPLSYLTQQDGWRSAMMEMSFVGLFIIFLLLFFTKNRNESDSSSKISVAQIQHSLFTILKTKPIWILGVYSALLVAPIAALPEMWGVEFIKVAYQLPATHAAGVTHTIFIGTALGGPLIGWLAAYVKNKFLLMRITTLGALTMLCFFLYWIEMPQLNLYGILFCYGLLTANMLLCFALVTEYAPPRCEGAAIGLLNTLIMAGGGLAQYLVGWLLNNLKNQHEGFILAIDYQIALTLLPMGLVFASMLLQFIHHNKKVQTL
jgi:MFS family permease